MKKKTAMQATGHDTTLLAEATRLWHETGLGHAEIAKRLGIDRRAFTALKNRHSKAFGPREYTKGDPTPEELERRKREVMEMRRAAGLRCPEDGPPDCGGQRLGAIRSYRLADRRTMTFRPAGL